MRYLSTRGQAEEASFCQVLLGGLATDGGLALPAVYPQVTAEDLQRWAQLNYADLAYEIISLYSDDIPADDLRAMTSRAYSRDVFGDDAITPVTELEPGLYLQHLSNGPTLAFKDLAMQMLGQLFEYELGRRGQQLNILGATSGDTGSAAEYAMRGRRGIRVFMLSPHGRMSAFQRAQMFSLMDDNIFNIAVAGVFDDCQDMVKGVSEDLEFKTQYQIGAVNSINWARVVAQVVYYFKGFLAVSGSSGKPVSFAVPTGNFGNVLAAHIARMMGLPIDKLVVATNENNVLDEFFRTGVYRVRGAAETLATSSPSMDISKASNFERFIFDLMNRDASAVQQLWTKLAQTGQFDLSGSAEFSELESFGFVSGSSTHANRLQTIGQVNERYGRLIDTHTADGVFVAQNYRDPDVPMICLETAQPVKFTETIEAAIGVRPPLPDSLSALPFAVQRFTLMPRSIPQLKAYISAWCDAAG